MFFTRFVVTALSFGAAVLAAPISLPGVDGLVPSGSSLPLPISGGTVPSLRGSTGGIGLPLTRRDDSTYAGALEGVQSAAQNVLSMLAGSKPNVADLTSSLGDLNSALGAVNSVLDTPGLNLDTLLAGESLDDITSKTSKAFGLVNTILSKVESLPVVSQLSGPLGNIVGVLRNIESALGISPELQGIVNGLLAAVLALVNNLLKGLGIII